MVNDLTLPANVEDPRARRNTTSNTELSLGCKWQAAITLDLQSARILVESYTPDP